METVDSTLVYFSATYTTKKVTRLIAEQIGGKVMEYDITQNSPNKDVLSDSENLLIVGMPVYAGRIPASALLALHKFKGSGTPAIIVCVYGNRDYDDALLELKDIVETNGFKVISAGAFIAQHAIFPDVAMNRPDEKDIKLIKQFADKSKEILQGVASIGLLHEINVKGNKPYKVPGKIPLHPKGNKKCNECGTCVKLCPVQAIPADNPRKTDTKKCIICSRCIVVCPQKSRHFGGLLYKLAGKKFIKTCSVRKEPDVTYN